MGTRQLALGIVGAGLALVLAGGPAKADVIDGDWCDDAGRHLSIRGPTIVTPGGKEMQGQYTRHSFRYVVPANEPASGQDVEMLLRNETTVHLRVGPAALPEIWHRCKPETS